MDIAYQELAVLTDCEFFFIPFYQNHLKGKNGKNQIIGKNDCGFVFFLADSIRLLYHVSLEL